MGAIIDRIKASQAEGVGQQVATMDAQAQEAQAPDAMEGMRQGRKAHGEALRGVAEPTGPTQMVQPSAEEQAMLTKAEQKLIKMIHSEGRTEKHLKAIFSAQDPVAGIGSVASSMVQAMKQYIPGMTEEILEPIGQRAVEELVELAETANPSVDLSEDDMAEAFSIGLQNYMKLNKADVDDDEVRGFLANG